MHISRYFGFKMFFGQVPNFFCLPDSLFFVQKYLYSQSYFDETVWLSLGFLVTRTSFK